MSKYLLFLILTLISFKVKADINKYDSLRIEERDDQSFIVHKVEPKETLFSISRRYKVKVKDILQHNEFVENGLKMYQELFIPFSRISNQESDSANQNNIYHVVQTKETMYFISKKYNLSIDDLKQMNGLSDFNIDIGDSIIVGQIKPLLSDINETSVDSTLIESKEYYTVEPSETLYSISLKFNLDIQNIKDWNNLTSNNLSVGQKLNLNKSSSDSVIVQPKPLVIAKPIDTLYVSTDNSRFKKKTEMNDNIEKTLEEGFASKIEKTENTRKYLALHRNAPIGTVIEVKNQMTNLSIFARVVGKLPETGLNQNVLIRLSHAAFSKLGALNSKIPVEIGFVIE